MEKAEGERGCLVLGITFIVVLRVSHRLISVRCSMVSIPGCFELMRFLITGRINQASIRNFASDEP